MQKTFPNQVLFCQTGLFEYQVRNLWELDAVGISCSEDHQPDKVLTRFNKDIEFKASRYTVKLPWKSEDCKQSLIDNRDIAEKRLMGLTKRLEKDKELKSRYDEVFRELEASGIIQEVPAEEMGTSGPVYYLPHHPVVREQSLSTKVRPVFDASCKGLNGVSLNDCMETGPKLIPDLVQILLRFRRWRLGMTADIQKAFLMIELDKLDRDVHRFLWNIDDQIRTMRFNRVTFGNAASPFLLNATLKFHLSQFEPAVTIKELEANLYVDDWLTGADTEEQLLSMQSEAMNIMNQGGFTLTKWASNCQAAKSETSKTFEGFKDIDAIKVLGLSWDTEDDSFVFKTLPLLETYLFTKRLLLSTTARLFDPIGFLNPYSISLKILFQEAWRCGFGWDDILPNNFQEQIQVWMNGLKSIAKWKIPRCISPAAWGDKSIEKELIVFSDASEKAYGCCLYLKTTVKDQVFINLIMSKTRVAPLKKITLPRLELLAALLAARLMNFVTRALGLENNLPYSCWSDSQIVLNWIRSDATQWKQFVRNRVQEIQELTSPDKWRFCPGKENPADLVTRGVKAQELIQSDVWLHGPYWLKGNNPSFEQSVAKKAEELRNEEDDENKENTSLVTTRLEKQELIDYERFSDFGKLVRVLTWVFRFINNSRTRHTRSATKTLSPDELERGRLFLLQQVQNEHFKEELADLRQDKLVKKTSSIYKLSPFIGKDGLLRIHGRLDLAHTLLYDEKHPVLLPKCYVSYLIVKKRHSLLKHAGVNTLITSLRNSFWIVSVRTMAKKICKQCFDCQRQEARPVEQVVSPLPEDRVKRSPPFSVVGIDHAGPLFCSDISGKKLYILLFTCAVIRAIHIELVDSLSLEDFLLAFKRFSARRGQPSIIYSDNAKTFRAAHNLLQREAEHTGIVWKFSVPLAPWWGGWWERLIRSVKSALRKTLGKRLVTRTQLETILQEIEACINSRPLTYVGDTENPLTPSHFLIGRSSALNPVTVDEYCEEMDNLELRDKCETHAVNEFWKIWQDSYIRNLPPMGIKKPNNDIKVGTLVLVREEGKPRLQWPLGIVTKTFAGRDGLTRAVELKTNKGKFTRALQMLHKLELSDTEKSEENPVTETIETRGETQPLSFVRDPGSVYTRSGRHTKQPKKLDL